MGTAPGRLRTRLFTRGTWGALAALDWTQLSGAEARLRARGPSPSLGIILLGLGADVSGGERTLACE